MPLNYFKMIERDGKKSTAHKIMEGLHKRAETLIRFHRSNKRNIRQSQLTGSGYIFLALSLKTNVNECKFHRTVRLVSHIIKIIIQAMIGRTQNRIRPKTGQEYFSFIKATRKSIFRITYITREMHMQKISTVMFLFIMQMYFPRYRKRV